MRRRDGVDQQVVSNHPANLPGRRTWQYADRRRRPRHAYDRPRRYRLATGQHRTGPADDPGPGHLLRRHGAHHRRAEHDHDELHLDPTGHGGVAAGRLQHRVLRRRGGWGHRRPPTRRDARHRPRHPARHGSRTALCHVPAGVRDRHGRAGQWRDRRPRQVRGLDCLRPGVGVVVYSRCRALGLGAGRLAGQDGGARLCGRPRRRDRLRLFGSGACAGARPAHRLQERLHAAAQSAVRPARRRAAVVRLVRVQRRFGVGRQRNRRGHLPQHPRRRLPRHARLALGRTDSATAGPRHSARHPA